MEIRVNRKQIRGNNKQGRRKKDPRQKIRENGTNEATRRKDNRQKVKEKAISEATQQKMKTKDNKTFQQTRWKTMPPM